jgi:choline-sulfatase
MKKGLIFALLTVALLSPVLTLGQGKRPNILFILTDDQAPQTLKVYGNTVCQTPNLDRLSAEGMTLLSAHHMGSWSGAVCTPSRTMIMTGINVWRTRGLHKRNKLKSDYDPTLSSMPAVFNQAGYDTFRTCKKGNSYEGANKLFAERHDASCRGGKQPDSEWHADQVMEYLTKRQSTQDKDPFLIYFGFSHPHDPRYGRSELLAKYGASNTEVPDTPNPKAPPLQINYLPKHPFHHGHPGLRDEVKVQGVMTRRDEATIRNELGREYACIEQVDIQIGRVLKQLEAMGEMDNTYILFTSDHGISVGRHGFTGKQNLYEHTWRVPFIVRGPGIKPATYAPGNTYLLDVLPTICDLANIEPPATVDGISFKSVLLGRKDTIRNVLYGAYCGGTKPGMRSIKMGPWKLIKYDVLDGKVRETQLFNLAENPNELLLEHHAPAVIALTGNTPKKNQINLAGDPKYANKLAEMEALLLAEQMRLGDPYRLWNQPAMTE